MSRADLRTALLAAAVLGAVLATLVMTGCSVLAGAGKGALAPSQSATQGVSWCSEAMGYPQGQVCGPSYATCMQLRQEYVDAGHDMFPCQEAR